MNKDAAYPKLPFSNIKSKHYSQHKKTQELESKYPELLKLYYFAVEYLSVVNIGNINVMM